MAAFGKVWPDHAGNLVRFLIICRRTFNGDVDMFLLLAVIGEHSFSKRYADPESDYGGFRSKAVEQPPQRENNLRSIADSIGIPRETARRKISQLIELELVTKQRDGNFQATSKAKAVLEPLLLAGIQHISGMSSSSPTRSKPKSIQKN